MTWTEEVKLALENLGGVATLKEIYKQIEKNSQRNLLTWWDSSVRATLQRSSSDSITFDGKEDIFFSRDGLGKGIWGLRSYLFSTPSAIDMGKVKDEEIPERVKTEIYRVLRDTALSREIKLFYKNKCQVCGQSIQLKEGLYAEAHHIQPLDGEHNGPDCAGNIIVLCPNHHVEFDYGVIAINPDSLELIHKQSDNIYNKKKLLNYNHILDKKFLRYHFDKIYSI